MGEPDRGTMRIVTRRVGLDCALASGRAHLYYHSQVDAAYLRSALGPVRPSPARVQSDPFKASHDPQLGLMDSGFLQESRLLLHIRIIISHDLVQYAKWLSQKGLGTTLLQIELERSTASLLAMKIGARLWPPTKSFISEISLSTSSIN